MAFGNGFSGGFGKGFGSSGSSPKSSSGSNITPDDLAALAKQYNIDPTTGASTTHPVLDFLGKALGAPLHAAGQALDYVNRPLYAVNDVLTNAFNSGKGQAKFDPLGEAYKGITGQEKNGWGQTLEAAGVPQGPTFNIPFLNHQTSLRGILGFAGDTLLNPANLAGLGVEGKIAGELPGLGRVFLNGEGQKALSGLSDVLASGMTKGADHAAILDQLPNELRTAGQRVIDSMPEINKYAQSSGLGQESAIRQAAKDAYFEHLGTQKNPLQFIDQGGLKVKAPFGESSSVIPQAKINSTAQAVFDKVHSIKGGAPIADMAKYLVQAPGKIADAISPTAALTRQGYGDVAGLAQMEQSRKAAGRAMGNAAKNELDNLMNGYLKDQGIKSIADLQVPGMNHINANLAAEANPRAALSAKIQMANENADLAKLLTPGEQKILQRAQELSSSTRPLEKDSGFLSAVKGAEDVNKEYIPRGFAGGGAKDFLAQHSSGPLDQIAPGFKNISFLHNQGTQDKSYDQLLTALHQAQAKGGHPDVTSADLADLVGGRVAAGHKAIAQWQADNQLSSLMNGLLGKSTPFPDNVAKTAATESAPQKGLPQQIYDALDKLRTPQPYTDPQGATKAYQALTNLQKSLMVFTPANWIRNAVSNPINSGVAAYQGPLGPLQALLDAGKKGAELATTKEGEIAPGVAKDSAMADALLHGGFNASMLNPATQGIKTPGNLTRQVNQSLEDPTRVALYQHLINQGSSPLEALGQVNKIQGDFRNQPGFMKVLNDIMPFTSWTAHNIPLQLESMAHNPGAFTAMANMQKNSGFTPQEEAALPAYDKAGFHLKGATTTDNQGHDITQVIRSLGLPVEDLQRLDRGSIPATIEQSILGALSPALRVPLELATNQDFYRGQDLNKETNLMGNKAAGYPQFLKNLVDYSNQPYKTASGAQKTQAYANPTTMSLLGLIPGMSLFDKGAAVAANPGKALPMAAEQALMPFKASPVDLTSAQANAQKDAQKQLLQALIDRGVLRQFSNTYNPATTKKAMATAFKTAKK